MAPSTTRSRKAPDEENGNGKKNSSKFSQQRASRSQRASERANPNANANAIAIASEESETDASEEEDVAHMVKYRLLPVEKTVIFYRTRFPGYKLVMRRAWLTTDVFLVDLWIRRAP